MRPFLSLLASSLLVCSAASAQSSTQSVSADGQTLTLCVTAGGGQGIKDLHFDAGKLANGTAGLTVTNDQGLTMSINVKGSEVNIYGDALPDNKKTTFTIKLPAAASVKFDKNKVNKALKYTNDGDDSSSTGRISTEPNAIPELVTISTKVPAVSLIGSGALVALMAAAGGLARRRRLHGARP